MSILGMALMKCPPNLFEQSGDSNFFRVRMNGRLVRRTGGKMHFVKGPNLSSQPLCVCVCECVCVVYVCVCACVCRETLPPTLDHPLTSIQWTGS